MPISPEARKARERFTKEAEQVLRLFREKVEARTSPGTVYHYTDDVGLSGILETGKLRLSNLFKLNDPSELRHGLSIASDILKTRALHEPLATLSADFHSYLETELKSTDIIPFVRSVRTVTTWVNGVRTPITDAVMRSASI